MAVRQAVAEPGDGRVIVDQLLVNDQCLPVLLFRIRRLSPV